MSSLRGNGGGLILQSNVLAAYLPNTACLRGQMPNMLHDKNGNARFKANQKCNFPTTLPPSHMQAHAHTLYLGFWNEAL